MPKKTYEYILLDWDGNIARTLDVWLGAFQAVLRNRGFDLSDEEVAASFGEFERYVKEVWHVPNSDNIFDEVDTIAKERLPSVELYPDALDVLHDLKVQGKQLALVTSSNHHNIVDVLERYEMRAMFDAIVARDDVTQFKPHAEPLEKALTLLGGSAERSIMIGDTDKDIGAANNAGCDSILFYPPEHVKFYDLDELMTHHPTHIVADFREILNLV